MDRGELERRLQAVAGFDEPRAALEQYPTPPDVAAHLLHLAAMRGDLADRSVVDLGAGTGVLSLGAALLGPNRVVGVERDPVALATARENEATVAPPAPVSWLRADATRPPLRVRGATVVSNPPFGAQDGREGADRGFLAAASDLASVSYTLHNAGSLDFLESFVADRGGEVTDAFRVTLSLPRQFAFHTRETADVAALAVRIAWA